MTSNEAYKIAIKYNPNMSVVRCFEYDTMFVFHMVLNGMTNMSNTNRLLLNPCSVDKQTGEVRSFKPTHISKKEYLRGKEIMDFKLNNLR